MPLPLTVSCSSKSRLVLPFWYRLTQVVLEKRPLNGCLWAWTWREVVEKNSQAHKLNKEDAVDRSRWRKMIKHVWWSGWLWVGECFFWYQPTHIVSDKEPLNGWVHVCLWACLLYLRSLWLKPFSCGFLHWVDVGWCYHWLVYKVFCVHCRLQTQTRHSQCYRQR